jgi:hypothetical protein
VHDAQLARSVGDETGHRLDVFVDDRLVDDRYGVLVEVDGPCRAHRLDRRLYLAVHRWDDLRAVARVDLVSVVLRRVVGGGDHHTSGRLVPLDGERQHGCGQHAGHQPGLQPRRGEDGRGIPREIRRAVPGVESHDHHLATVAVVGEPVRHSGGGAAHHRPVHAVGAGPHRTAQSGGPEGKRAGEAVAELGFVAGVEQLAQLLRRIRINFVGDPRLDEITQVGDHDRASTSSIPKRGPVNLPPTNRSVGCGCGSGRSAA